MNNNYHKFDEFIEDIVRCIEYCSLDNNLNKTLLRPEMERLNYVYKSSEKFRGFLETYYTSKLSTDIRIQFEFFKQHYYDYIVGNKDLPSHLSDISRYKDCHCDDSYFNMSELYNWVFSGYGPAVLKKQYKILFTERLREEFSKGIYKFLCPICQKKHFSGIRHLDHFLSKEYFPVLCLSKKNLIPTCYYCNSVFKSRRIAKVPIVYPLYEEFPIQNINFELIEKTDQLNILSPVTIEYRNFYDLYDFKNRINNDDMNDTRETILDNIEKEVLEEWEDSSKIEYHQIERKIKQKIRDKEEEIKSNSDKEYQFFKLKILEAIIQPSSKVIKKMQITIGQRLRALSK